MVRPRVLAILRLMTSSTFAQSLPERSKSATTVMRSMGTHSRPLPPNLP
jgi:hypothetical protein